MESIEVVVGRIGKPHGLRGEVTVDVRTDEPDAPVRRRRGAAGRAAAGSHSALTVVTVARTRWHQSTLLATFEEIPDRNAAEAARGHPAPRHPRPRRVPDDPDEFYDHQLVGLAAYDVDGTHLGEVTAWCTAAPRTC